MVAPELRYSHNLKKHSLADEASLQRFLGFCHVKRYPARATIIFAGDKSDTLYYITSGSVSVIVEDEAGNEIVLAYLNAGDFFGEMGFFDVGHNRSAWVRARTACEVAEMSYTQFHHLAMADANLLFLLTSQMALRLKNTNRKVYDLAFVDVSGRIARTLLELCREPDAMTHPEGMMIKITRQELGRIVGCSREMAGRVLKNLEEHKLIKVKGHSIVVLGTRS